MRFKWKGEEKPFPDPGPLRDRLLLLSRGVRRHPAAGRLRRNVLHEGVILPQEVRGGPEEVLSAGDGDLLRFAIEIILNFFAIRSGRGGCHHLRRPCGLLDKEQQVF